MIRILLLAGSLAAALFAAAAEPVLHVADNGEIRLDELRLIPAMFDRRWNFHSTNSSVFQKQGFEQDSGNARLLCRVERKPDISGTFRQTTRRSGNGEMDYSAEFRLSKNSAVNELVLSAVRLPANSLGGREIFVDGKKISFPTVSAGTRKQAVLFRGEVRQLVFPLNGSVVTISGKFKVLLQDDRCFGKDTFSLRIYFEPVGSAAKLSLKISLQKYQSQPLDLAAAANAGFADEIPDDRKGGWTDQGRENDLRELPAGLQNWHNTQFNILSPEQNSGRSCIMLAGKHRMYFPRSAEAFQQKPVQGKYFYLLHAIAWPPGSSTTEIGTVELFHTDRSVTRISVTGADVGNWWNPVSRKNGDVVWSKMNRSAMIGLYRSGYAIPDKPVEKIRFRSSLTSPWGIVAASVASTPVVRQVGTPCFIVRNKEWQPVDSVSKIEPGSVLDFSWRLDAPAGKFGRPVIRNGHIVFENRPQTRVRFFGVNLSRLVQFLDKAEAEALAGQLAACGYNAVRIHHHDPYMVKREGGRSTELDPVRMDQLDYLVFCLKQRGIYIVSDLYVSRHLEVGEIPEFPGQRVWQETFKPLLFVLDSVMENWKRFTANWLNHRNPYTGLTWKEDPALVSVSLVNEDTLSVYWNRTPEVAALYRKRFEQWKSEQGISDGIASSQDPVFSRFLRELYDSRFQEMKKFVRDLGLRCMISDQNFLTSPTLTMMRRQYDFVENHFYWDHPEFLGGWWKYPAAHTNLSSISRYAAAPGVLFGARIFGRPFLVTEFDFAAPNAFRAEGGVLTGAYAALQDWDGIFQFVHYQPQKAVAWHFDSSSDPVKSLSLRIGAALFLPGGVAPAEQKFAVDYSKRAWCDFGERDSSELNRLGLMAQVGSIFALEKGVVTVRPDRTLLQDLQARKLLRPGQWNPAEERFADASGSVVLDCRRGIFEVCSSGGEAVVLPPGSSGGKGVFEVKNRVGRGVFACLPCDRLPLADSKRILILHLTDALPEGTRFADRKRNRLEAWGGPGWLAARGEATIRLRLRNALEDCRLYAVSPAGRRIGELKPEINDGVIQFEANVFSSYGTVFAYELTRK